MPSLLLVSKVEGRLSQQVALPGQPAYQANQQILRAYGNGGPGQALVSLFGRWNWWLPPLGRLAAWRAAITGPRRRLSPGRCDATAGRPG